MTKIDPSADLINALRAQIAARTDRKITAKNSEALRAEGASSGQVVVSARDIQRGIGNQIKALNLGNEKERLFARRIFIESVIAWDFGDQILNDRRFDFVVKEIEEAMNMNSTVSRDFDKLLEVLQNAGEG